MSLLKWIDHKQAPLSHSLLENFFTDSRDLANSISKGLTIPAINIKENDDNFEFEVAVPGKKKKDFNVRVENNNLIVSSAKSEEDILEEDNYTKMEYNYNSFTRSFYLPENADKEQVNASYEDGVLKIIIGKKKDADSKNKIIPIK